MRPLRFKYLWVLAGWLYVVFIFYMCLTPDPPHIAEFEQGDKLKHLAGYGLLMFWFSQIYSSLPARILHALVFCGMGVGIEYLQRWGGVRTFEYADMLANASGVALGYYAGFRLPLYKLMLKA